jgi:hypothetical protein
VTEMTDEQKRAAAKDAVAKMNEGLQEYLDAIADVGEPEAPVAAVMLFESRGMAEHGQFTRIDYITVEPGSLTSMLGMSELATDKLQHRLRCTGHDE